MYNLQYNHPFCFLGLLLFFFVGGPSAILRKFITYIH